jgi:hypothetical protein
VGLVFLTIPERKFPIDSSKKATSSPSSSNEGEIRDVGVKASAL